MLFYGRGPSPITMNVHFRPVSPEDLDDVRHFLSQQGWAQRVADPEQFRKMIEHTSRTVVAFDGDRVVGFVRALCDEVSNGYISMVAVAPDKRRQGLGRELIRHLIGDDTGITWILRAGHGSDDFWERVGFKRSDVAMERVRS